MSRGARRGTTRLSLTSSFVTKHRSYIYCSPTSVARCCIAFISLCFLSHSHGLGTVAATSSPGSRRVREWPLDRELRLVSTYSLDAHSAIRTVFHSPGNKWSSASKRWIGEEDAVVDSPGSKASSQHQQVKWQQTKEGSTLSDWNKVADLTEGDKNANDKSTVSGRPLWNATLLLPILALLDLSTEGRRDGVDDAADHFDGPSLLQTAHMAVAHVNQRQLIPGFHLHLLVNNSKVFFLKHKKNNRIVENEEILGHQ